MKAVTLPWLKEKNHKTPGAFGNKKISHRNGRWVTAIINNHKGKPVRAKVWDWLDSNKSK
jgi:hypothetical protein